MITLKSISIKYYFSLPCFAYADTAKSTITAITSLVAIFAARERLNDQRICFMICYILSVMLINNAMQKQGKTFRI